MVRAGCPSVVIRAVGVADLVGLRDVEWAAGRVFADIGMAEIAEDEPLPMDVLDGYRRAGQAWVAVGDDDRAVAYLIASALDGDRHVDQVSVHPDYARRGIGRALLDHLGTSLTLTTFADVPWNAPYYVRCGFRVLGEDELTPGLRAVRQREEALGLTRWPRVCMRR